MSLMKILAVVDFGLNENTGGYKRNYEVMKRLCKLTNVDIIPSLRNVRLYSYRRDLISLLKSLNSSPEYVIDLLENDVTEEDFINSLRKDKYDIAVVYSNSSENIKLARSVTTAPIGVQLQLEPFYRDFSTLFKIKFRGVTGRAVKKLRQAMEESIKEEQTWRYLIRNNDLNFIVSVSKVPLINSGLDKILPYRVTEPGNAYDPDLLSYRSDYKEDYAVYFTRLIPEKGLFEVPLIWKKAKRDMKLYVMGRFEDERDEEDFLKMVKRFNVNIEYLGFKEGKELFSIVSKAKFTVYPSHYDSFSLVVLESLALGTPVFAYNTLALQEIYKGIKGVHLIEEDNIREMAKEISTFNGEEVPPPEKYSSWDKVVSAEFEDIKSFVNHFA